MNSFRSRLLATAASLTILFAGVAGAQAQQRKQADPGPGISTVESLYRTADSKALGALETRLNQERPPGTPRVVFADPDVLVTQLELKGGNPQAYPAVLAEYLKTKGASPDAQTLTGLAGASLTGQPAAGVPQLAQPLLSPAALAQSICVVVPYDPNLPADAFMHRVFDIANPVTGQQQDALSGVTLNLSLTRQNMEEIVNAREAWGCFDTQFVTQVNQTRNFDQIMALHRREVFKDVGGLMQAVRDGADPQIIQTYADFRGTQAALTTGPRAEIFKPGEIPFYGAVIYETSPALQELQNRITAMGLDKFRALSGADMRALAADITASSALTPGQATHLMGFAMLGNDYFRTLETAKAPPAEIRAAADFVERTLERQGAAAKKTLHETTPAKAEKQRLPLADPAAVSAYVQREIFNDGAVQKDETALAARLKAREALVDRTRALMDEHPGEEGVIRQVLQGVFTSDPLMQKTPPAIPAAPAAARANFLKA